VVRKLTAGSPQAEQARFTALIDAAFKAVHLCKKYYPIHFIPVNPDPYLCKIIREDK
jgi:hypothetical protein